MYRIADARIVAVSSRCGAVATVDSEKTSDEGPSLLLARTCRSYSTPSVSPVSSWRSAPEPEIPLLLQHRGHRTQRSSGSPSLLATSGVMNGRPSANTLPKGWFTKAGAPRM